jgi:UDP-N-acetylglucosamine--N-acetylmuramyl-(pentapeptide) pyrophosphoryl-undecaprenol N-acetylglucosamine transferase
MSVSPTLMVMAGGTGGHVFPGLAVANHLRELGWKIVWLGNPKGMEATLVPSHGFEMQGINFGGLRGKGLLTKLLLPLNLLRAFVQSIRVLRQVRPDVVLGLGGYITFPAGMMAVLLGKPLVLHEQNSIAGLANKVLAKVADARLVAFPNALPDSEWVGNPVRREIVQLPPASDRYDARTDSALRILIVGGSLGAQVFNQIMPEALAALPATLRPVVVHQTGRGNEQVVRERYAKLGVEAQVSEFIQDMAQAYGQADLVISRAGAMAVSEIAVAGVASLLVPYPHAVDDHQTANGRFLQSVGAAQLWPQKELTPERFASWFTQQTRQTLKVMAQAARQQGRSEATRSVAQACIAWAEHEA